MRAVCCERWSSLSLLLMRMLLTWARVCPAVSQLLRQSVQVICLRGLYAVRVESFTDTSLRWVGSRSVSPLAKYSCFTGMLISQHKHRRRRSRKKEKKKKNIQHQGFAGRHRPNY
ncbi:hypothetical protein B0T16DRAFT_403441 [Cercophora newfieldiana]|uniref:Secreted protein n=1 Tax=Cercophora newfieldiana TaxID=92897 RepID=A0AA40CTS1_9PEZI|nr:hypothetical protein B0T16DRAFT_403441 [Cercophora newfieldiana]